MEDASGGAGSGLGEPWRNPGRSWPPNPSVEPELPALTPQRAARLNAVVDVDENPANPPS
jgi:hypothetical protein